MQEFGEGTQTPIARLIGRLSNSTIEEVWEIRPSEALWIGRDGKRCGIVDPDPSISNWHAKIYSVLFNGGADIDALPPLVYVEDFSANGTFWNGTLIGKGNAPRLLTHGDSLRLGPTTFHVFGFKPAVVPEPLDKLQETEQKLFEKRYAITSRKLGSGGFGSVYLALHCSTKRQLACKVVTPRLSHSGDEERDAGLPESRFQGRVKFQMREVDILKVLNHPNIMSLEKVFYSDNTMYIFTELMTAGDLFSYLEYKGGSLTYCESGVIVRQILKALEYLHAMEVVHRDIKPDNVFLTSLENGARVVLGDFGWARSIPGRGKHRKRMTTFCGTKEYIAPEMYTDTTRQRHGKGYTKAIDMWALGELTVVLLTGDSSFTPSVEAEHAMDSTKGWSFTKVETALQAKDIDRRPKDFIKKLLVLDEAQRLTATRALNHSWFTHERLKGEWEAVYQRSLQGWKPRPSSQNIIEKLVVPKLAAEISSHPFRSAFFSSEAPSIFEAQPRPTIRRKPSILPSIEEEVEAAADERLMRIPSSQRTDSASLPSGLPSLQRLQIRASPPRDPSEQSTESGGQDTDVAWASPPEVESPLFIDNRTLEELSQESISLLDQPPQLSNLESSTSRTRKRDFSIYSLSADKDIYDEVATDTRNFRTALNLSQAASKKRKEKSAVAVQGRAPVAVMISDPADPVVKPVWDLSSVLLY
ncbi:MAG: hypothetical protein M1812_007369 [Candelaria pacifica]|nr:MAG: hypothetical protein M1812_007369 [Candelaria pacifica]